MGSAHRAVGALALLAVTVVVAGLWLTAGDGTAWTEREVAADDGTPGTEPSPERRADAGRPARAPRKRAYVRTDEDVRRDVAREALVAAVAQARTSDGAANVRPMTLPGAPKPQSGSVASVRLSGSVPTAAALALDADPGAGRTLELGLDSHLPSQSSLLAAGWGPSSNAVPPRRTPRAAHGDIDPWANPLYEPDGTAFGTQETAAESPRRRGLRADYFDFLEGGITDVPDLANLPPSFTRVEGAIDFPTDASFALPFEPETFGALWRGFLVVETPGEYEFAIGSDDGARLRIAETTVIEHRSLRPYGESTGKIRLEAGRHAFEVGFYENFVFASCRLFWRPPGATERALVPPSAFEPPDDIAAVDPPHLASVTPSRGRIGDEVTIRGGGFSATAALERVTFAGVPAEIVAASPTELVVKVPIGASTGHVVVQVGAISTRPFPFEVENLLGLYGEYFLVGAELTDYPDFDAIAPYFVRLDGPLDWGDDDLWQMPYEPDTFAARWFGYLYVPEEDDYEITLRSDDGAFVAIDGTRVVDLPGVHPPMERSSVVALTAGFHPIELRFFENYGIARLTLSWRRRDEPTRVPIPRGFFFAPDALATREAPRVASLEPSTAVSGDEIVVHGAAFGADPRVVRVEFPGGVWARPSFVGDDLLRVRVPYGAGTGDVRVHVGVRGSGPQHFTLGEDIGLRGDYFELAPVEAASAMDLPAMLASRTPTLTRIDTRWRFGKAADWDLPFAKGRFAVRWSGSVCVEITQKLQLALQSESAALLRIDGGVAFADPEPHRLRERYGGGRLTPGEHAIELYTLHVEGHEPQLHVFVTPYGRADHLEFPPTWLRPRAPK